LVSSNSGQGPLAGLNEKGEKPSGSIKCSTSRPDEVSTVPWRLMVGMWITVHNWMIPGTLQLEHHEGENTQTGNGSDVD
jgi:hypothetical protein